jgi:hypothetical protein
MTTNYVLTIFVGLVVIHFAFFAFNGWLLLVTFLVFLAVIAFGYRLFLMGNPGPKATKVLAMVLLGLVVVSYLTYCYVTIRDTSFDGFTTYLKAMYIVKSNPALTLVFRNPIRPFLIEAILGFIWRFTYLNLVGVVIGLAVILTGYLSYYFYKISGKSNRTAFLSLLILFGSPMFINLALFEYKIDIFLAMFSLLSFIYFYKLITNFKTRYLLMFGFSTGVTLLVKFTFLPVAVLLCIFALFEIAFYLRKKMGIVILSAIFLVVLAFGPIAIWTRLFGAKLSYLGYISKDFHFYQVPLTVLSVNENIYKECRDDITKGDYNQYLPNNTISDKIMQPINYVLNDTYIMPNYVSLFDPGIFLYAAILIFIPVGLVSLRKLTRVQRYIFITTALYEVVFFLKVGPVFWYLIPVLPLMAPALPEVLGLIEKNKHYKTVIFVLVAAVAVNVGIYVGPAYARFLEQVKSAPIVNPTELVYRKLNLWDYSKFVDHATSDSFVYNINEFGFDTFSANTDKVLPSTHFFAGTRSFESLYKELEQKNVRYISTNILETGDYTYTGCALNELIRFKSFSGQYLTPAYTLPNGAVAAWKLKELY